MNDQALQEVRQHLAAIYKRRGILLTCVGVSLLIALVYNYTTRPLYQASAQILIDPNMPNVLPTKEVVNVAWATGDFQTQLELLRGRILAERVVTSTNLHKSPELQMGPLMSPWERFQRRFLGRIPASALGKDGIPLSPAVAAFRSRLSVEPVRGSRLVNLRFSAYDPGVAAEAANALAQAFIEQSLEFRYTTSSEATGWLSERLKEQQAKAEAAQKALQEYREKERLVNLEERQGLVDQKLASLNNAAVAARMERIARETLVSQLRSLSQEQLETFPLLLANGTVQSLRGRLAELRVKEAKLSQDLGDKHPDMIGVRAEIRAMEDKLRAEVQNVVRGVEAEYRSIAQQEAGLLSNIEVAKQEVYGLDRKAVQYGVLKREVESNQQLYRELLGRTKESGLEGELRATNVRIVDRAELPRSPVFPNRRRNYLLALVVGLGAGLGLCLLIERLDNTFKTPEDVKQHLALPFLGMVPDVGAGAAATGPRVSPIMHRNPAHHAAAEAYRVLRTNLIFSSAGETGRALLVSSPNPSEGKTTTAVNLAESLAQNGARVLLVDADLRRPTIHQHFGLSKTPGLTDLVVRKIQASQAIQTTAIKGLQVLPCGYVPPNAGELLGSANMREVLQAFREHYDWVLLDTPPVLGMADPVLLATQVDGLVLVVAAETSHRPAAQRAVEQVRAVGGKVVGVVLNKVDLKRNAYYYGQYYGEYYRSYYAADSAAAGQPAKPRNVQRS